MLLDILNQNNESWFIDDSEDALPPQVEISQQLNDEEEPEIVLGECTEETAKAYLKLFFKNKKVYFGGPIPLNMLLSDRNVNMVLKLQLKDCIDVFYEGLERSKYQWTALQKNIFKEICCKVRKEAEKRNTTHLRLSFLNEQDQKVFDKLKDDIEIQKIELFLTLQREAASLGIPRQHSGGLLLVWLNFCVGCEV